MQQLFKKIVAEQLSTGQPTYVQATLRRLTTDGFTEPEAKAMMAAILAYHMSNIIDIDQAFDNQEYKRLLDQLPEFPDNM